LQAGQEPGDEPRENAQVEANLPVELLDIELELSPLFAAGD
jgi:hypothetical protein